MCTGFWDRQGANIASRYKKKCSFSVKSSAFGDIEQESPKGDL